jgi:hypothetical protein
MARAVKVDTGIFQNLDEFEFETSLGEFVGLKINKNLFWDSLNNIGLVLAMPNMPQ